MTGWLIALAVLIGLAILPLGVRGVYRENQPGIWVLVGPLKFRVFPGKPKEKKTDKKVKKSAAPAKKKPKQKKEKGGSYRDFIPIVENVLQFLGQFRRKLRINRLEMKLVLAGGDPCDLAVNYGKAWAALGNLLPQLERIFVIKKRDLEVECDFASDATLIFVRVDATITLARTLHLLSWHGVKILINLLKLKKLREGGAKL
jgi:hypothetical protein